MLTQAWALVDAYLTGFIGNAIAVRASRPSVDCGASGAQVAEGGSSAGCASSDTLPWQRVVAAAYTDEAFAHGVEIIIQGFERWRLPIPASGARLSRDAADRLSDGCPSATAPLRRRESCGSLAAPRIFRNSQNWGLTGGARFRNILTCARRFRAV